MLTFQGASFQHIWARVAWGACPSTRISSCAGSSLGFSIAAASEGACCPRGARAARIGGLSVTKVLVPGKVMRAATPLIALEAVVFDTETTGLDPSSARMLQIGVCVVAEGVVRQERFATLIDPGIAIPPATTAIHGIRDEDVAGQPRFRDAFAAFEAFRAGRVVIGHTVGFDLAMLKRECGLAGLAFTPPPALDTRLLAEIAFPRLAGYTLEKLAAHLGIETSGFARHDAAGDAGLTAAVFLALEPHLRTRGIRTLGEADQACRNLSAVATDQVRAGWVEPSARSSDEAMARIDPYPFRHRTGDVASPTPVMLQPDQTLHDAMRMMSEKRISSVFVGMPGQKASEIGILTERDVLRTLAARPDAFADRIGTLASRPLASVPQDAFVYRAIGRMARLGVRHLAVVSEDGRVVGALSQRDLLRLRGGDAAAMGDSVDAATSVAGLAAGFARVPATARSLLEEGISASLIAAMVSREIGAMTRRAAELSVLKLEAAGLGPAPSPYAILVLGSGGRGESLLAPDQDNALVWAEDVPEAEAWFARFGAEMATLLDQAGVPLCKGGVMAREPGFRGSLQDWRRRIEGWATRNRPEDLLAVDIFYDFRVVAGDGHLAADLADIAFDVAARAPLLAKLLAGEVENYKPPLTLFGGLQAESGRVDLKKGGLFPIVAAARCLSLVHGVRVRGTVERLRALGTAGVGSSADFDMLIRAHGLIIGLLLEQQLKDIAAGAPPSNAIQLSTLEKARARELTEIVSRLRTVGTLVKDAMFKG